MKLLVTDEPSNGGGWVWRVLDENGDPLNWGFGYLDEESARRDGEQALRYRPLLQRESHRQPPIPRT